MGIRLSQELPVLDLSLASWDQRALPVKMEPPMQGSNLGIQIERLVWQMWRGTCCNNKLRINHTSKIFTPKKCRWLLLINRKYLTQLLKSNKIILTSLRCYKRNRHWRRWEQEDLETQRLIFSISLIRSLFPRTMPNQQVISHLTSQVCRHIKESKSNS